MTELRSLRLLEDSDQVLGAVSPGGKCESNEFIENLNERPKARFKYYLERLAAGDRIKSPENMRPVGTPDRHGNQLHELKVHKPALRLYVMHLANPGESVMWVATHGTKKVSDSKVPREVDKAFGIFYDAHEEK